MAYENRGALLRVIGEPGDATTHLENRAGEPTANPYLYMASQIISGMDGVEKKIEPPPLSEEPYSEDMPPLPGNQALTGCRIHLLQRIDTVVDRLLEEGLGLEELVRRFEETLEQRRSEGWKGLKTIVAYRTGLAVDPDAGEREAAESLKQTGPIRRRARPLRDFLLRRALGFAAESGLPFQFHTAFSASWSWLPRQRCWPPPTASASRKPTGSPPP